MSINLQNIQKIHFIGIGGIGMSGLARLFLHEGKLVSGSDRAATRITDALTTEGVTFFAEQTTENISADIDMVVYTEAMSQDHEEMIAAKALGVPMMNYFEALGLIANEYYLVAIAGAHGKTTTTAMMIDVFEEAGLDPTAIVGSLRAKTKSNYRAGSSKYFIVEACEYKRDFLSLRPDVLVITNVEHEHADYYKDLYDVQSAFRELAERVPEDGIIIAQLSDTNIAPIVAGLSVKLVDYTKFFNPLLKLTQPGLHNQLNAAAVLATADFMQIKKEAAVYALENFAGTWRRFEHKGFLASGAPVYDDYGHHPTEIRATLQGVREKYPDKKVLLVFQPHTYSRLVEFFDEFATALRKADAVFLAPVYAARERALPGINSNGLAKKIGTNALSLPDFESIAEAVKDMATGDTVVLVMGAGDITKVTELLI